jgi:hypothetical protein
LTTYSDKSQGKIHSKGRYLEIENRLLSGDWHGVQNATKHLLADARSDPVAGTMLLISDLSLLGFYGMERNTIRKQ